MNRKPGFLLICFTACGLAAPLRAQESPANAWPYKVEVFGSFGNGRLYNGDSSWGSGLDYGGGIGVRPFSGRLRRIGFEFEGGHLDGHRASSHSSVVKGQTVYPSNSQDLNARLLQGSVLYHFRSGTRVQPFASIGIGHLRADYSRTCVNCVFEIDPATGQLIPELYEWGFHGGKTGIAFGAGIKFAIRRHLSIRPQLQFMDTTPGTGANLLWIRLRIGLGLHF